jgi:hypothetical protein
MAQTKWRHKTAAEKAAALVVEQRDVQCAAAGASLMIEWTSSSIDMFNNDVGKRFMK